jgi:chromatin licensing and DNA replication factor 1
MSPEDDSTSSQNKLTRRPPCSRSLKFDTPIKNEKVDEIDDIGGVSVANDVFNILPENLLQSVSPIVNSLCFHPYQVWF